MTIPLIQRLLEKGESRETRAARQSGRNGRLRAWPWIINVVLVIGITGCARAYHDYPDGCVPYAYCPSPPLPYDTYHACLTPVAKCYLAGDQGAPVLDDLPIEADDMGPPGS